MAKLADDLYWGGDSSEALLNIWRRVLQALDRCNLPLSPVKTVICPKATALFSPGYGPRAGYQPTHIVSPPWNRVLLNRERFQVFYRRLQSPQSRASQLLKRHRSPGVRSHWPSVFRQTTVR